MIWIDRTTLFLPLDYFAITLLVGAQLGIGWPVETLSPDNQSMTMTMNDFLRDWMREMATRQSRMFEAQAVAAMRQGRTFSASTTIGSGLASQAILSVWPKLPMSCPSATIRPSCGRSKF